MIVNFEKWHGCHNDFIIIQLSKIEAEDTISSLQKSASQICNRNGSAVGADGILVLISETRDVIIPDSLKIINQDGSIAKNCGNGIRCAAAFVLNRFLKEGNQYEDLETLSLDVEGQEILCRYLSHQDKGDTYVAVDMGHTVLDKDNSWHEPLIKSFNELNPKEVLGGDIEQIGTCEIGNPHVVLFSANASIDAMKTIGSSLQNLDFMDGINVHLSITEEPTSKDQQMAGTLVKGKISEIYKTFVWERGVGPTQACGSGACAVAALSLQGGFLNREEWIAVDMPGGRLFVKQRDPEDQATLAGPATYVFKGEINI